MRRYWSGKFPEHKLYYEDCVWGAKAGGCASGQGDEEEGEEGAQGRKMTLRDQRKKSLNKNVRGARRILGVPILIVAQTTWVLLEAKINDAYSPT